MLTGYPNFHYFKNGNNYSGSHVGMRYFIEPVKEPDPSDETGKNKLTFLQVTLWPEPWGLEYTAPEKRISQRFPGSDEGVQQAADWIAAQYSAEEQKWSVIPNILDCEPDIPNPGQQEGEG